MAAVPQLYSEWKLTFLFSQLSSVAADRLSSSHTQSKSATDKERKSRSTKPLPLPIKPQRVDNLRRYTSESSQNNRSFHTSDIQVIISLTMSRCKVFFFLSSFVCGGEK